MSERAENRVLFQDQREIIFLKRRADEFPGIVIQIFIHQEEENDRRMVHIYCLCSIILLMCTVPPRQLGTK